MYVCICMDIWIYICLFARMYVCIYVLVTMLVPVPVPPVSMTKKIDFITISCDHEL